MNQRLAESLRALAERYDDPHLYEQAAAELDARGQTCAAARCRDRAKHYRGEQEVILTPALEAVSA